MKRYFYLLFLLIVTCIGSKAATGDTTWVQAHYNKHLDYYNNFDTTVVFPDGTKTYRKVYMIFTMGKYVCPGNPQYCGDWDYTVQNVLMTPRGDTFELGRLITPYAHTAAGPFTANWKHRYIFDVTNSYPALRDSALLRIHYSGYSGGFTANIQFAFIEGTPERDVLKIDALWQRDYNYGHGAVEIDSAMGTLTRTAPAGTQSAELEMNITGHGGDDNGCSEFCPNNYAVVLNNNLIAQQDFYRTNCDKNDLYPQSGTWVYPRANWCPGALVNTFTHTLTGVSSNSNYRLAISFPPYTSPTTQGGSPASYTIAATTVYYGAFHHAVDASIEDIVTPTNAEWHVRSNPHLGKPVITVHNGGSSVISSIQFQYGVVGRVLQSFTWTGTMAPLQTMDITFPELHDLKLDTGNYQFTARVVTVNGQADEDVSNNQLTSTFRAAPNWPADIIIQFKSNGQALLSNNTLSQTNWHIEDMSGNIVAQRSNCGLNRVCSDTINLPYGNAYRLVVSDAVENNSFYDISQATGVYITYGDGLKFYNTGSGYIRAYDLYNGPQLPMAAEQTGNYEGNFGGGFVFDFYTGDPTNSISSIAKANMEMQAFPNPAADRLQVVVNGIDKPQGNLDLIEMTGRKVLHSAYLAGVKDVDISSLTPGVYQLWYTNAQTPSMHIQKRIVIQR